MKKDIEKRLRKMINESFRSEFNITEKEEMEYVGQMTDMVIREFRGKNRVDDDDVNPGIRDVLYLLEAMGILKMEITEKHIIDGRIWKNHYWAIKDEREEGDHVLTPAKIKKKNEIGPNDLYKHIPDEVWSRGQGGLKGDDSLGLLKRKSFT